MRAAPLGQILTRGGNALDSNGADGAFTGSIATK
jgi:hypothetical protein